MRRTSPRFKSPLQALPLELLVGICRWLDLPALGNLRSVSKGWKSLVESDDIMKPFCIQTGLIKDLTQSVRMPIGLDLDLRSDGHLHSHLRQQGWTEKELSSYWTLLAGHEQRCQGLPFREMMYDDETRESEFIPSSHRVYPFDSTTTQRATFGPQAGRSGVHRLKMDAIDRVFITTGRQQGGLQVTCIDTGQLLWGSQTVPPYSHLEYENGWAVTCHENLPSTLDIWQFDRVTDGQKKRGCLKKVRSISSPGAVEPFRLHFPHLAILTIDLHARLFDVRNGETIRDINLQLPDPVPPFLEPWLPRFVDFDGEHLFALATQMVEIEDGTSESRWCLLAYSQQTAEQLWFLDQATFVDNGLQKLHKLDIGGRPDHRYGRWSQPFSFEGGPPLQPSITAFAVQKDDTTGALCLLWDQRVVIFPDFKRMISRPPPEHQQQQRPIVLFFDSYEPQGVSRVLAVANGLLSFNIDRGIVLVNLVGILRGEVEDSLMGFLPSNVWPYGSVPGAANCSAIEMSQTMLAFQSTLLRSNSDGGSTLITSSTTVILFDFAELGRSRTAKGRKDQDKHTVRILPAVEGEVSQ